ncbi:MAG TPA: riboflavin kinase, partial [Coriobacteriia bacterium]|nr:riboflavin kinase [Coriobacteriia bacterium]
EQGRELGFPTANIVPDPFAAIPGDGVYAGRVVLEDGSAHPAGISVGVPPTFPEARDYVEAHLIGFEGDLYGSTVTLEFIEKLRDQRAFGSLDELTAAIRADVERAAAIAGATVLYAEPRPYGPAFELNPAVDVGHKVAHSLGMDVPLVEMLEDGTPVIENPAALASAENAVSGGRDDDAAGYADEEWVEVLGARRLAGIFGDSGYRAALITGPLRDAGITFAWSPYSPEEVPSFRIPLYGLSDRSFSLLVPASQVEAARAILSAVPLPPEAGAHGQPVARGPRRTQGTGSPIVKAAIWIVIVASFLYFLRTQ